MSLIKISEKIPFTSSKSKILPVSAFIDVTPLSVNPHGFIIEKADKSVFTFNASPCMVQKREHFTPKAQIFFSQPAFSPTQTPEAPSIRPPVMPYCAIVLITDSSSRLT